MESAKALAREMLDAININDSGLWQAVAQGIISFPVNIFYLSYDFIDTDHHSANLDDKIRVANLIKKGVYSTDIVKKIIFVFVDQFLSGVDVDRVASKARDSGGNILGKIAFSQVTGIKLGVLITENAVGAFFAGVTVGSLLYFGSEVSRAIYTSRILRDEYPLAYWRLRETGDLDLLYYLVENRVKPFQKACVLQKDRPEEFEKVCDFFFGGLENHSSSL